MVVAVLDEALRARKFRCKIAKAAVTISHANVQKMQPQPHNQIGELRITLKRVNVSVNRLHRRKSLQFIAG
jgi:hypothetical protein